MDKKLVRQLVLYALFLACAPLLVASFVKADDSGPENAAPTPSIETTPAPTPSATPTIIPANPPAATTPEPLPEEKKKAERYAPEYIEAELFVTSQTFVAEDAVVIEGAIAFDQVFAIHWDELVAEHLKLSPFKVVKVSVGPQRPYSQSRNYFADYRTVQIVLALDDMTKKGKLKIPAFQLRYSWHEGEKVMTKEIKLGPWSVERVPIKISSSLSAVVLHLGENAELKITVTRDKNVRVLNQFLATLKDEKVSEAQKAEVRRWVKALEARKEAAFSFESPDFKPMAVVEKTDEQIERAFSSVSVYSYRVAYYEDAKKNVKLPEVKIWYMVPDSKNEGFQDPKAISCCAFEVSIASRILGKDMRLDGPELPDRIKFSKWTSYFFDYGLFVLGFAAFALGATLFLIGRSSSKKSVVTGKAVSFREASRAAISYINPVTEGGNLSPRAVYQMREKVVLVVGAALGLTEEQAKARTAVEFVDVLEKRYHEAYVKPVSDLLLYLDWAISQSDINVVDGVRLPGEMIKKAYPFMKNEWLWNALLQM